MTTETVDYWRCKDKSLHVWQYLGRVSQAYRCTGCLLRVTKGELKGATDA